MKKVPKPNLFTGSVGYHMVEQARVELASYRIAEKLSTCLCRNFLKTASSAAEENCSQKS